MYLSLFFYSVSKKWMDKRWIRRMSDVVFALNTIYVKSNALSSLSLSSSTEWSEINPKRYQRQSQRKENVYKATERTKSSICFSFFCCCCWLNTKKRKVKSNEWMVKVKKEYHHKKKKRNNLSTFCKAEKEMKARKTLFFLSLFCNKA